MNDKTTLDNCTFIKAILICVIVVYHSIVFWTGTWISIEPEQSNIILSTIAKWLNTIHIYAFTVISGYIYYYGRYEMHKYDKCAEFIGKKALRLCVPCYFVSGIWAIWFSYFLLGSDVKTIIVRFVLAESPDQLWFLMMLFVVFVIFHLLSNVIKKSFSRGLVIVLCLYLISFVGAHYFINIFQIWTGMKFLIYFWLGFVMRQYTCEEKHPIYRIGRIPTVGFFIINITIFSLLQFFDRSGLVEKTIVKISTVPLSIVMTIAGSLFAIFALQNVANKWKNWKSNHIIMYISRISMPVYLFHQQLIYVSIYFFNGIVNPFFDGALNFIISFGGAMVIGSIFMKYRFTRILIGEK